jgi:hypothetical protein
VWKDAKLEVKKEKQGFATLSFIAAVRPQVHVIAEAKT